MSWIGSQLKVGGIANTTYPFRGLQEKFPGRLEVLQATADCAEWSDWNDPRPCGGELSSRVLVLNV